MGQMIPSLISLNHKSSDFASNLKVLDAISNRTSDTIFVYYVREGMTHAHDILDNARHQSLLNGPFGEFLLSLGCVINVSRHVGWTGHISSAWKILDEDISPTSEEQLNFDGRKRALYWADVSHEVVFITPSGPIPDDYDNASLEGDAKLRATSDAHSDARSVSSMSDDGSISVHSKTTSENDSTTRSSLRRKFKNLSLHNIGCDVKVLVLWMESIDDQYSIPISNDFKVIDS